MNKQILEDLKDRNNKAESKYFTLKNNILDGSSKNINKDFNEMTEALWEMERLNSILMEQEYADRRIIEELHSAVINLEPTEYKTELLKG